MLDDYLYLSLFSLLLRKNSSLLSRLNNIDKKVSRMESLVSKLPFRYRDGTNTHIVFKGKFDIDEMFNIIDELNGICFRSNYEKD